jgi:hypothetical protein
VEAAFAATWAEGQAMPVEQLIAEALEEAPAGWPGREYRPGLFTP